MTGRSLPEVMMMLIPEAWEKNPQMSETKKAFYEYNSCLMEPWDGPASIPFTDGNYIGAVLDRNGLRPARYLITQNGFISLSSEAGVIDLDNADIVSKGRLGPGQMLCVDLINNLILDNWSIKQSISSQLPYRKWLENTYKI